MLKLSSKRVMYVMYKKVNCKIEDFTFCGAQGIANRGATGKHAAYEILRRLRDKGLIVMMQRNHNPNLYYLTPAGKEIAKPIVEEIDDYKQW